MSSFNYKAKDRSGQTVTGTVEADSPSHAAAQVREMGCLPMDIRPARVVAGAAARSEEAGSAFVRYFVFPLWTGVNIRALALFYRQFATMLGSGMSILEALRSLGSRTSGRLGVILREAYDAIQRGGTLSQTLERHPRVFSRLQVSLVRVGESSGLLETMAERIAAYLEHEMSIRQMISKALVYPIIVMVMAFAIWVGLPNIGVLTDKGAAAFLLAVWPMVRLFVFGLLALIVFFKLVFQFETPRVIWDAVKIQPPVIGGTARKIAMSRFCRALAVLYSAGVTLSEAVSASADACGNLFIGRGVKPAALAIQSGQGLTESLTRTRVVTPMVLDMLATGERTGNMDAVLQKVAEYMDDEADATIHKLGIALFVIAILIVAVIVLMLAVRFYGGYFEGMMKTGGGG